MVPVLLPESTSRELRVTIPVADEESVSAVASTILFVRVATLASASTSSSAAIDCEPVAEEDSASAVASTVRTLELVPCEESVSRVASAVNEFEPVLDEEPASADASTKSDWEEAAEDESVSTTNTLIVSSIVCELVSDDASISAVASDARRLEPVPDEEPESAVASIDND
jgi:hypothetical protein